MTPAYCRDSCGTTVCEDCPRPRLLDAALPGVLAYEAVHTQWQFAPMGGPTGLRYEACWPTLRQRRRTWLAAGQTGVPPLDDLFADLQVIEAAMVEAAAEQRANRSD